MVEREQDTKGAIRFGLLGSLGVRYQRTAQSRLRRQRRSRFRVFTTLFQPRATTFNLSPPCSPSSSTQTSCVALVPARFKCDSAEGKTCDVLDKLCVYASNVHTGYSFVSSVDIRNEGVAHAHRAASVLPSDSLSPDIRVPCAGEARPRKLQTRRPAPLKDRAGSHRALSRSQYSTVGRRALVRLLVSGSRISLQRVG
ncbi:hypothetical protein PsYK624_049620 [Phanerochaete sordida]|uniref:Uncharacterized protein n=1 Tax=Phanerochaete sordida TaxID=48140 RepID=A0A9P3G7E4_9APHY|nr:hypothetical protein PsYK624_049620 [Phanerochaete sordida]